MGLTVFLDDGGVMNENAVRGSQWRRLIGEYLVPRLGGEPAGWAAANVEVMERQMEGFAAVSVTDDFNAFMRHQDESWLREMCELVGVAAPSDFEERLDLARQTAAYVIPRVRSAFPEVVEAVRRLHAEGRLDAVQSLITAPSRPKEELYDLSVDPWEIDNLADSPRHAAELQRLRQALDRWIVETRDQGEIPEPEAAYDAEMAVYVMEKETEEHRQEIRRNIETMKAWAAEGR